MDCLHFDSKNHHQEAQNTVDGRIAVAGNINNPETVYARRPKEVRHEVFRDLDTCVQMIAPECSVPLAAKLENLLELAIPTGRV